MFLLQEGILGLGYRAVPTIDLVEIRVGHLRSGFRGCPKLSESQKGKDLFHGSNCSKHPSACPSVRQKATEVRGLNEA